MSHDLNLPAIADNQAAGQWQTSNDADAALGNALADILTVDFSGGDVTLNNTQFRSAMTFVPSGLSTTRSLTVPAVKRALFLVNNTDATYSITVTRGATTVSVTAGSVGVFSTDGTANGLVGALVATGSSSGPIGKHTIWVPATAMTPRSTNGAAQGTAEMATNKNMVKTLDFDASTQEFAQFDVAMPKSYNGGTITFIPYWSHAATVTNFGVAWGVDAIAISDDDTLDVAFGTAQVVTDTGGTTNDLYVGAESSALAIAGSPATGDLIQFRIHRDPANGSDTLAIDARLHGVRIIFTTNAANDN
ncbi:hypothetical protein [Mesorhizobium sp.]|uniref:hypothetical protein n=1 Tax=Mesorhizobium sp. TaxID=1871066 RepID=UPI0011F5E04F|nr:hypothetical protein [Mesorhizobium sp.]TIO62935.1 MAG: hypothetical protein E5X79_01310 [Mesorhizobium sp.]